MKSASAEIRLCLGDATEHVYRALLAEVMQPSPEKGKVEVDTSDDCVSIKIVSKSLSGLRALLNSFLILSYASYSTIREVEVL